MAEEFAFNQPHRQCCTVDPYEWLGSTHTSLVNGSGEQFFTSSGFTRDQHRARGRPDSLRERKCLTKTRTVPHQHRTELLAAVNVLGQRCLAVRQLFTEPVDLLIRSHIVDRDRDLCSNVP